MFRDRGRQPLCTFVLTLLFGKVVLDGEDAATVETEPTRLHSQQPPSNRQPHRKLASQTQRSHPHLPNRLPPNKDHADDGRPWPRNTAFARRDARISAITRSYPSIYGSRESVVRESVVRGVNCPGVSCPGSQLSGSQLSGVNCPGVSCPGVSCPDTTGIWPHCFLQLKGVARGGAGGGPGPPPKSGGSQKYIRGDPCDLGSEAKNRGSGPPRNGWGPPRNQILATPLLQLPPL